MELTMAVRFNHGQYYYSTPTNSPQKHTTTSFSEIFSNLEVA